MPTSEEMKSSDGAPRAGDVRRYNQVRRKSIREKMTEAFRTSSVRADPRPGAG
jgi:hypothetical protein